MCICDATTVSTRPCPQCAGAEPHIHDCTGPGMTCHCGYKFTVPRFLFTIEVYDNQTKRSILSDDYSTDGLYTIAASVRQAAEKLDQLDSRYRDARRAAPPTQEPPR